MIYLLAAAVVIVPLVILDCIKKAEKAERTLLPFSVESTAPSGTSRTAMAAALKTPAPSAPPRPPPQPPSDVPKGGDASTTKKSSTDKQTPSVRTETAAPSRPDESRSRKLSPKQRAVIAQYEKKVAAVAAAGSPEERESNKKRDRKETRRKNNSHTPCTPSTKTGTGQTGSKTGPSKKSRKANIPCSPSWKEWKSRAKKKAALTQSGAEVRATMPSDAEVGNRSAVTALSEYDFRPNKHQMLGMVDQVIQMSDENGEQRAALNSQQSVTAQTHSYRARSPFFDGAFSEWIADRVGSQADG